MPINLSRRSLLKSSGFVMGASALVPLNVFSQETHARPAENGVARLSFNENPFGPSPRAIEAVLREVARFNRYADPNAAQELIAQIAAFERLPAEQVVLGEILTLLGNYLSTQGGAGGEFLYSTPGYLALINAAARAGGVGIGVPLSAQYQNDLTALASKITTRTRGIYLVNPHNPTGTVNESQAFIRFLRESSEHATVIVDEAYLEYTEDFNGRSAVSLVREGANVVVFRTFDKIHGLAGLPIGYVLAPRALADALRKEGAGDVESLGRLNIAAASASLADTAQVENTRSIVAREREKWFRILGELQLTHTESAANFIFFDSGRPQATLATGLHNLGIEIGRPHPPYTNWARITIGLPEENQRTQIALRKVLANR